MKIPSEQIDRAYSDNVDAVMTSQPEEAAEAENRVVINTYRSLVQAGLLDTSPSVAEKWVSSDGAPSLSDIPGGRPADAADDMGTAMSNIINKEFLRCVYDDQFREFFETE